MNASHDSQRVYVWQLPVRLFHQINALCITVLCVTGWLISHPPGFLNAGEASSGYWFGTNRFIHFAAGYVLLANFLVRIYWSFVGNKYSHWRNFLPLTMAQIRQCRDVLLVDILQVRSRPVHALGHNAVAYFTYAGTGLLTVFQIVSGFALYAPTSRAWFPRLFTWVTPLFGSEQNLRLFHYDAMWLFILFVVVHVYLVVYHDYVEGHGVLSSIIGGWKFMEKRTVAAPDATGISGLPARKAPAVPVVPGTKTHPTRP